MKALLWMALVSASWALLLGLIALVVWLFGNRPDIIEFAAIAVPVLLGLAVAFAAAHFARAQIWIP